MTIFLALAAFALAGHEHAHHHGSMDSERPAALAGESIYQLRGEWTNQEGRRATLASQRGAPVVLAMMYTRCSVACPFLTADLKKIEAALPEPARGKVRFAVFSFDWARDDVSSLRKFAESRSLDLSRWSLHQGSAAQVRDLAMALGIRFKRDAKGDFEHSNVITVLDAEGVIRFQQVGLRKDPKEAVDWLKRLAAP